MRTSAELSYFSSNESCLLQMSFYECVDKNMDGKEVPMSNYKGNVLLLGKK